MISAIDFAQMFIFIFAYKHTSWSNVWLPFIRINTVSGYIDQLKRVEKDIRFVKLIGNIYTLQWFVN